MLAESQVRLSGTESIVRCRKTIDKKGHTMKLVKAITLTVAALALLASAMPAFAEQSGCDKAKAAGKECEHKCCVKAKKDGKVCEKCNPKK